MTFTVLVVCANNTCRSPLVAAALRDGVARAGLPGSVHVDDGGVAATPGQPVCRETLRVAESRQLNARALAGHRSREVAADEIEAADLVLTPDRRTRSAVLHRLPAATTRTFTVREAIALARHGRGLLAGHAAEERLRSLVAAMDNSRGLTDLPGVRAWMPLTAPWRRVTIHGHDLPDAHEPDRAPHRLALRMTVHEAVALTRVLVDAVGDLPQPAVEEP